MQLKYALWTYRIKIKKILETSPYMLVYGQELVFLMNLKIHVLNFMRGYVENEDKVQIRLMNLSRIGGKMHGNS